MNALSRVCAGLAVLALVLPALTACGHPTAPTSGAVVQAVRPTSTPTAFAIPTRLSQPSMPLNTPEVCAITSQVDCYLEVLVSAHAFSGSVLLAKDGKVLVSKGYGMADVGQAIPNTPQTQFRAASLTKAFTAMSILILRERGELGVDDPICNFLEDCPNAWRLVTLRHLLTHTSGIPDFVDLPCIAVATTLQEKMAPLKNAPLDSQPGMSYRYSNSGYVLLGHVIEQASGKRYSDFVRDNILLPLGMTSSGFEDNTSFAQPATGYKDYGVAVSYVFPPLGNAAGGLISTVEDMYRWSQALFSNALVSAESTEEMFTPTENGYGYGWHIGEAPYGKRAKHGGSVEGFVSYIELYPESKATIIVLSNFGLACATESMLANILFQ